MNQKKIIIQNKTMAKVVLFLDTSKKYDSKNIIDKIIEDMPKSKQSDYAGFTKKSYLKTHLKESILGKDEIDNINYDINTLMTALYESIEDCMNYLNATPLEIYIFPCYDKFVSEKMFGVCGFSPWSNVVHLYINTKNSQKIKESLLHEIAHAMSPYPTSENNTILATFLYEGIAEKFREAIIGGQRSNFTTVINKRKIKEILESINITKPNYQLYNDLFFGSVKYKTWTGYSIGYYLTELFLQKTIKNKNWHDLIRLNFNQKKINLTLLLS